MNLVDILNFYENSYHKTIEARDRLLNRIQLTSAIVITDATVIAYMCRTVEVKIVSVHLITFSISLSFAICSILYALF